MDDIEIIRDKILELKLTLLPVRTLDNIRFCIEETTKNNIEGDFIETGVWQGGACIYAWQIYKHMGAQKKVFVADSFEGLPKPNASKYPQDIKDNHWTLNYLKIGIETVQNNFKIFGELDDSVTFLKGWFKDSLPIAPIEALSILRLDGDMYESTMDSMVNLYPKLSSGGYCIIDDYGHKGCIKAVTDYRLKYSIGDKIEIIDKTPGTYPSAYWKKA